MVDHDLDLIDHIDHLDRAFLVMRCCSCTKAISDRSHQADKCARAVHEKHELGRADDVSQKDIRDISAQKDLDHELGMMYLIY